jgi:nucleotide-binding universal stress UspA family protein
VSFYSHFNLNLMSQKSILVPFDLTDPAVNAANAAASVANSGNMNLTLLHVTDSDTSEAADDQISKLAARLQSEYSINVNYIIRKGRLFQEISAEADDRDYQLMVIGSHGYKGLKEKLLGTDILKLLKNIPVPAITIQEGFNFPEKGFRKILLPASSHDFFDKKIEAVILMAQIYDAEVHVYTVEKPGFEWSAEIKTNIVKAIQAFELNNIRYQRVNEQQNTYSPGYARQILQYAQNVSADLIAVISLPTKEYYYIADSDKELLLTNELRIPVLSVSDKSNVHP